MPQPGDHVKVHYTGTLDDGTQFDSSRGREPLGFEVGAGQLIPGFEAAVVSLTVGDSTTFRIEPAEAYGEIEEERVVRLPIEVAPDGLDVDQRIQLANGVQGVVTEVSDEGVVVDTNHPLAGQALTFEVELLAVGDAS